MTVSAAVITVLLILDSTSQIDLGSRHKITAVATQGIASLFTKAWVKGYKVQSSDDGRRWVLNTQVSGVSGKIWMIEFVLIIL